MKNAARIISTTVICLGLIAGSLSAETLRLFSTDHSLRLHSKEKLRPKAQKEFKGDFRDKSYYAAFAYSSSGAYGYNSGHNTLETAYQFALNTCNNNIKNGEPKCKIYASIVPKGYSKGNGQTLGESTTRGYKRFIGDSGPRAFALSSSGTWWVIGSKSINRSKSEALFHCNSRVKARTTSIQKVHKCKIIAVEN